MRNFIIIILWLTTISLALAPVAAHANSEIIRNQANNNDYQRIDTAMDWHSAKSYCESQGGHLATITSQQENDFIGQNFIVTGLYQHLWLGATDEVSQGRWKWVTGENWAYTYWNNGEPNGGTSENCLEMREYAHDDRMYVWNDYPSSRELSFVCEWERKSYQITGIALNLFNRQSVESGAVVYAERDTVIQFIGKTTPNTTIDVFVEDPFEMQSRKVTLTSDANGEFLYPASYTEASNTHRMPTSASILSFLFDSGEAISIYSINLDQMTCPLLPEIKLTYKEIGPQSTPTIDEDCVEYMRYRQNVYNGETMNPSWDKGKIDRCRQKLEIYAEIDFLETAASSDPWDTGDLEFVVYGYQIVVCAGGILGAGATLGTSALFCTPLVAHGARDVSHHYIDKYESAGDLSPVAADILRGSTTLGYGVVSFAAGDAAGGGSATFEIIDFYSTVIDGSADLASASVEIYYGDSVSTSNQRSAVKKPLKYVRTVWNLDGSSTVTMLIVPLRNMPPLGSIQLLLTDD